MDHNEVFSKWPPQQKDVSGIVIAIVSVVGICVTVFTLMSVSNYHGASYPFASAQWGKIFISFVHWFWRMLMPVLPG